MAFDAFDKPGETNDRREIVRELKAIRKVLEEIRDAVKGRISEVEGREDALAAVAKKIGRLRDL